MFAIAHRLLRFQSNQAFLGPLDVLTLRGLVAAQRDDHRRTTTANLQARLYNLIYDVTTNRAWGTGSKTPTKRVPAGQSLIRNWSSAQGLSSYLGST